MDSKIGKLLLKVPIVNDKIKSLARQAAMEIFGGNFDEIIIGGAPFNAEVEAFLKKIGFPYTIAYGMTECGPIICSSRRDTLKLREWKSALIPRILKLMPERLFAGERI